MTHLAKKEAEQNNSQKTSYCLIVGPGHETNKIDAAIDQN
jgi:hypothetical protein